LQFDVQFSAEMNEVGPVLCTQMVELLNRWTSVTLHQELASLTRLHSEQMFSIPEKFPQWKLDQTRTMLSWSSQTMDARLRWVIVSALYCMIA